MKKQNILVIMVLAGVAGFIGGMLIILSFERRLPIQGVGSLADWVSGIATVLALLFAYKEISNSREQFEKEHEPELKVYTGWKNDYSGVKLHIVPVNTGLATGIYRYLGICRKEDLNKIFCWVKKAKYNNINAKEVDEFAKLIYHDLTDIGQNNQNYDRTGMSLLYPNDGELFQTIKSNYVGKILDKRRSNIEKQLGVDISKDVLEVLYIDPNMRVYSFKVEKFDHSKDMPDIRVQ